MSMNYDDTEPSNATIDIHSGVLDGDLEMSLKSKKIDSSSSSFIAFDDPSNPFAPREGKELSWSNVNMNLSVKGKEDRKLLDNVWGNIPSKEITAIMGPSGAGKTSLLNILAGRARSHGKIKVEADVKLDKQKINPTNIQIRKQIAFVAQEESLTITATPREAIMFSAKLRLPKSTSDDVINKLTESMLSNLGLLDCADTIIGGGLIKGLSGGEKKRTSVGVELVVKPSMVFLDEPTSGLDSFSAVQLVQVLKRVANAGASVMFTIHQPSSEVFNSFSYLLLLNKGRVMYSGSVEDVPSYFAERKNPMPERFNPADWIMQVAQTNTLKELEGHGFFPKDPHQNKLMTASKYDTEKQVSSISERSSFCTQLSMLFKRELKGFKRNKAGLVARYGITAFMATLQGAIFFGVGSNDFSVPMNLQSHFGAVVIVLLGVMFGTAQPALVEIPLERPVFLREYATNHYSVTAYFISKLTIEIVLVGLQTLVTVLLSYYMIEFNMNLFILFLSTFGLAMSSSAVAVFLGCACENADVAQELLPLVFVPQMLFAGFFVATELIPKWLRWCQYVCFLTYSLRITLQAEFGDCEGEVASFACNQVLEGVGIEEDKMWLNWLLLAILFACFRLGGLYILRAKATKFH